MPPVRPSYRLFSAPYAGRCKEPGMANMKTAFRPAVSSWLRRLVQTQSLPASPPRHEKVNEIRAYSSALDVHLVDNMLDVEMEENIGTETTTAAGTPTAGNEVGGDTEVETDGQSDSSMGSSDTSKASDWSPPHLVALMNARKRRAEQEFDTATVATERNIDERRSPSPEPEDDSDSDDSRASTPVPGYVRTPSPEAVVPPDVASPDPFNEIMRNAPGGGRARAEYFRTENLKRYPSLVHTEVDENESPN